MSVNSMSEFEQRGERLMACLNWSPEREPDWATFRSLIHEQAVLVPSARPAVPLDRETFIDRMRRQREEGKLTHFAERQLGVRVCCFGNVATVLQTYSSEINGNPPTRGVNAMVWARTDGEWRCVSIAWDQESDGKTIADEFLGDRARSR